MSQKFEVKSVGNLEGTGVPYEKSFSKLDDAIRNAKKMKNENPDMTFIIIKVVVEVKTSFVSAY